MCLSLQFPVSHSLAIVLLCDTFGIPSATGTRLVGMFDFTLPFCLTRLVVHVDLTFGHARLI